MAALNVSGMRLVTLAHRTGMSMHTIYSYSTGRRTPSAEWTDMALVCIQRYYDERVQRVQTVTCIIGSLVVRAADCIFRGTLRARASYLRTMSIAAGAMQ